ncbi:AAA family ATPase [Variovorax sp. JS1663]|uniref:AAA family ATPase n=1 Tax=Variovorax sp. JS1663 TaxID=1851577 RepID=UPI000B347FD9|nr:AAA family ATPase [Variovorax sp. JS1663]OUL98491.1 histidine kinase [Variovorax sp. JS1663]
MKIAIISPNTHHLQEMGRVLEALSHAVVLVEGGKSRMRQVAEQEQPELMIVDGMCCDPNELALVEYISTHHPRIAVILLCAMQTPEFLINSMRAGVREVLPSPVNPSALEAAVNRLATKLAGLRGQSTGQVLAFMPCKGGSGATFLATNLGWQLAESKSVLLVDLDLQFGSALSYVNDSRPGSTIADVALDISRLDASFLAASAVKVAPNYGILAAPEDPSKAMEVKPEHVDAILGLAVAHYDFVLLDVGRVLNTLVIRALDRAHRIYPVLQPGLPHIRNAARLMGVFKSLGYSANKIELIVNRFEKAGEIGLGDIRRTLGSVNLLTVPECGKDVNASINRGVPLAELSRSNPVSRMLADLALSLSPRQEESPSLFDRLFRRA